MSVLKLVINDEGKPVFGVMEYDGSMSREQIKYLNKSVDKFFDNPTRRFILLEEEIKVHFVALKDIADHAAKTA